MFWRCRATVCSLIVSAPAISRFVRPAATNLITSRVGYAFNTRTFLDTLLQYNTDLKQFSANVRFDLIHRPLSDLFIVYNEQQLTDAPVPVSSGRGLIVKYTHMVAF